MEQANLKPKDLKPMIGELNRVYEVLSVSGSGYGDRPIDGRQTARDLFDLFILDHTVKKIHDFTKEINKYGANFPEKAFITGLASMPWIDMMDDFTQLEFDTTNPYLATRDPLNIMATVKVRMQEVFKEMA